MTPFENVTFLRTSERLLQRLLEREVLLAKAAALGNGRSIFLQEVAAKERWRTAEVQKFALNPNCGPQPKAVKVVADDGATYAELGIPKRLGMPVFKHELSTAVLIGPVFVSQYDASGKGMLEQLGLSSTAPGTGRSQGLKGWHVRAKKKIKNRQSSRIDTVRIQVVL